MHQPSYVQHNSQLAQLSKTSGKNQRKICLLGGIGEKKLKKKKIVVLGDSHARGCARELASCLGNKFEVNGMVMPGAGLAHISTLAKEEIRNLTPGDAVVIWGGANDVSRNNSQDGLKSLTKFVKGHRQTNIIIMCVPHRHDLPQWSCVNKEVENFNRKVVKLMKPYQHVTVMRIEPDRKFFTQHGLHMNNPGKERLATELANTAANILIKHKAVLSLGWKNEQEDSATNEAVIILGGKNDKEDSINKDPNEDSISLQEEPKAISVQQAAPKDDLPANHIPATSDPNDRHLSTILRPQTQTYNNQGNAVDDETLPRTSNRQKKKACH
jgi:hypothetical protein